MYLKALEIQGFKSFPERTVITFHEGVTAIIGPNGSGKSNVTDAIRWVLGEQSVKTLRGSRMEDVIFSGTQSRRAMSFAEVSMIIDNGDYELPVEYSEVQITRRLYRSGESEYLLNKTVCRLRDISRLFMDTGLGRDGYSIVGQGRVDEILSHKSEDRRRIFEEASGIVKYKTSKEEAERKLQSTEQNLLRINDLIAELESRLEPLKTQSIKARRLISLSEELKKAEIALILDSIDQQQDHLSRAAAEKEHVYNDLLEAQAKLADLREKNQKAADRLKQIENQTDEKKLELERYHRIINEYKNQLVLDDERILHLQEQQALAASEEKELSCSLSNLDAELSDRRKKADTLLQQKTMYQNRLEEAKAQMQAILLTLDASEKEIEAEKRKLDQLKEQIFEDKNDVQQIKNQINLIESRRRTIQKDLQELVSDLDRLRLLREETQSALSNIRAEEESCEAERKEIALALEDKRRFCNALSERLETARRSLQNQAYRHQTLLELERNYEGYSEAVRHLFEKAKQDAAFAKGIQGTVGRLLSVDKQYELAIETALGPAIQNIVTDTEETAARLIEELKQTRSGRATFLPLKSIQSRPLDERLLYQIRQMTGFIGLGSELVQVSPDLQPVADFLLGRAVIVRNLKEAIAMARRTQYACRLVTIEGDVLSPGGSMSGGYRKQNNHSILGRSRELDELLKSMQTLSSSVKEMEKERADAERKLEDLARALAEQEKKQIEQSHIRVREEAKLASQMDEIEKVTGRQHMLQAEDEQLVRQKIEIEKEMKKAEDKIRNMESEAEAITKRIESEEDIHSLEREKRDLLRDDLTKWGISLQSVEESYEAAQEMIHRIEKEQLSQEARLHRRRNEQEKALEEISKILAEKNDMANKIEKQERLCETIESNLSQLSFEKTRLEQQQNDFFSLLESATGKIADLQNEIGRIEARGLRFEGIIDDAKNRLWETYEMTADQASAWRKDHVDRNVLNREVGKLKNEIKDLGMVNLASIEEYESVKERYTFLTKQRDDIEKARQQLKTVIAELTEAMKTQFVEQFHLINENFGRVFSELFGGGTAELVLEDENDVLSCGIEIKAQPPGKKLQNLLLFSGGERCLTAIALLFAILKLRPTPFCVLDEVESALDDANVLRFTEYIRRYANQSQFILVTHRKGTMEAADRLYGVTMQERGISRILSMNLDDGSQGGST